MQIGDIRIDAIIDGETAVSHEVLYLAGADEESWAPYKKYFDCCTGLELNTLGSYLIRYDDKVVLHDTGIGPKPAFPFVGGALRSGLWAHDVSPLDVTDVIFSHLHLDHIGWTSVSGKSFFPNATIHVDRRDWDFFSSPDYQLQEWEAPVTDPEADPVSIRFAPVKEQIRFYESEGELLPGIVALDASGHTPGSVVIELSSRGERGLLIGDLVHTQGELAEDGWQFAIHHDPEKAMASIERFRKRIYDERLPFAAAHFPGMKWGRLVKGPGPVPVYETI
jgi:glyoxylase-like metal-dependent hydrolase (beta-lactamase superfamily II)